MALSEIIGWLGTLIYIAAYALLTWGKLRSDRSLYHILNVFGAAGLIVNGIYHGDYPSIFVNLAWLGIALVAAGIIFLKSRSPSD